jgi:hypothetical protein
MNIRKNLKIHEIGSMQFANMFIMILFPVFTFKFAAADKNLLFNFTGHVSWLTYSPADHAVQQNTLKPTFKACSESLAGSTTVLVFKSPAPV